METPELYDLINTAFTEIMQLFGAGRVQEARARMDTLIADIQERANGA